VNRAPLFLPGRTVIFDYGEVISLPQSKADQAVIEGLAGVGGDEARAARFWAAYQAHRDALDQGTLDVAGFWRAVAGDTGASWNQARVHELWVADLRSWISVNPETVEVLADLKAGRTPLALLSNAGPDLGSYFRHGPIGDFFDACYVSGELGLLKPNADIYQHVLGDLGITAAEAVFIDNRAANVAGAQAIGITGHVFTGGAGLRAFLGELADLPARPLGRRPGRRSPGGVRPGRGQLGHARRRRLRWRGRCHRRRCHRGLRHRGLGRAHGGHGAVAPHDHDAGGHRLVPLPRIG
jgi:putative hydrolase of the HAD superfamily